MSRVQQGVGGGGGVVYERQREILRAIISKKSLPSDLEPATSFTSFPSHPVYGTRPPLYLPLPAPPSSPAAAARKFINSQIYIYDRYLQPAVLQVYTYRHIFKFAWYVSPGATARRIGETCGMNCEFFMTMTFVAPILFDDGVFHGSFRPTPRASHAHIPLSSTYSSIRSIYCPARGFTF